MRPSGTHSDFAQALLDRAAPPASLRIAGDAETRNRRFGVYRNNVFASLVPVLASRFPAVARLTGDEYFRAMAAEFVAAHPPASPVLLEYGGGFPEFISKFPPARDIPYLASVAALEWLRHEAAHAADATPLALDALAALDPARLGDARLTLHPAARLFASGFPAVSLWRINAGDGAAQDELKGPEAALIARPDLSVHVHDLAPGAYAFLAAIAKGEPFGEALAAGQGAQADFDLAATLATVFSAGAISGATIP